MDDLSCTVLVVGAGPGGYAAAIRAGQLGLDVVIVEAEAAGGTCLNVGCIPSKALIHAAEAYAATTAWTDADHPLGIRVEGATIDMTATTAWKDAVVARLTSGVEGLLRKAKVRSLKGWARMVDGKTAVVETDDGPRRVRAEHVVLATGSRPVELPCLPFGGTVLSSTEALSLRAVPDRLAVVGGGYIGLELGTAFAKLGARVTVIEAADRVLPSFDPDLVAPVARRLEELGVDVLTGTAVTGPGATGGVAVTTAEGTAQEIPADRVLVTVGRAPAVEGWGLDDLDLDRSGPFVRVDGRCRTSMRGVYAIGDLTGEPMLAHRATAQGELVAEVVAGRHRDWDAAGIPTVTFTDPEIVSVGLTPREAEEAGHAVVVGRFPFAANGRALSTGDDTGFVRTVARAGDNALLGLQAVGPAISELSSTFSLALEMGARLDDLAATIHAHPTRSEAVPEAAMQALGRALHL